MARKFFAQFPSGNQYLYEMFETGLFTRRGVDGSKRTFRLKEGVTVDQFIANMPARGVLMTTKRTTMPSDRKLQEWAFDGVVPTPDGCRVEPDGYCEHGWNAFTRFVC